MKVAVTSVVIFDVPEGADLEAVRLAFDRANRYAIGKDMVTVTGQRYVMRAIERLEVKLRDS